MTGAHFITDSFVEDHTQFKQLVLALKEGFAAQEILVPSRHHHDFPNPKTGIDSTLLLMPAWNPGKEAGVKIATVSPENGRFNLPSIQATYIFLNAENGTVKAIFSAKSLTAKRTAAASALASNYLSNENSTSMLMIGTGALAKNLILAHCSVRPIKEVFVWGRNIKKAQMVCDALKDEPFKCKIVKTIAEKVSEVNIISCATLSRVPLVLGKYVRKGQHIDLVGAYKKDMREADDETVQKASVFVDTLDGMNESGDIAVPLKTGTLKKSDIKADLFSLCSNKSKGRIDKDEITLFKSVGHALEDLVAASYYYHRFSNGENI
ncbi:bifunctional Delta(1)-pyrroline-2-carboxylate/Delta(1)-piperideine-2-carboxylate reductase [Pareuzebyella sediminis]|uniref:ornithine cyclodeaminase family protein n=1 Tax=Pareuzebyella sediminis TaxID=2607998 RepID=UPI0011ED2EA5|nr:ornithine cyclodeaminase family protein [Pareuzebyella sediminis]